MKKKWKKGGQKSLSPSRGVCCSPSSLFLESRLHLQMRAEARLRCGDKTAEILERRIKWPRWRTRLWSFEKVLSAFTPFSCGCEHKWELCSINILFAEENNRITAHSVWYFHSISGFHSRDRIHNILSPAWTYLIKLQFQWNKIKCAKDLPSKEQIPQKRNHRETKLIYSNTFHLWLSGSADTKKALNQIESKPFSNSDLSIKSILRD